MDIKNVIYSEELNLILKQSEDRAKESNLAEVSLENVQYHILLVYLTGHGSGRTLSRLAKKSVKEEEKEEFLGKVLEATKRAEKYLEKRTYSGDEEPNFSDALSRVIERVDVTLDIVKGAANDLGIGSKGKVIDTETFFTAMFFENTEINNLLKEHGIDNTSLLSELTNTMDEMEEKKEELEKKITGANEDMPEDKKNDSEEENFDRAGKQRDEIRVRKPKKNSTTPIMDEFGLDMTEKAEEGGYDPVVGRDKEVNQLIQILNCRKKCNAMLLGDAGVGKTSIVEGLAQRIITGNVPRSLKNKKIISVSTTDLIAGTQYRGQLEERVQQLCQELKDHKATHILYIDEFAQAVGEGNSSSISDLIKPALARGEITVIASTTVDEYRKTCDKDGAIKRRFQRIMVSEPTSEETFKILKGLVKKYQDFHKVRCSDDILRACVSFSEKYLYDRRSPDRAIDIMDTSMAATRLANPSDTEELDRLEKAKAEATKKKVKAIDKSDFSEAKTQRDEEDRLDKEIADIKKRMESADPKTFPEVTIETVAEIVSKIANVSIDTIITPELDKIRQMGTDLKKVVIGQDEAIDSVVKALSKSYLGLRNENKPVASFLFCGSSGSGKTLVAEKIAETVFGRKDALLRIDGGEYVQETAITKLLGATASYVGYGDSPILEKIRETPMVCLLVDEAEKINERILNTLFLSILDTGRTKLANGKEVDFRQAIVIMTSNIGTKDLELKGNGIGFGEPSKEAKRSSDVATVMKAIEKQFRPEVRARIGKTVIFNSLGEPEMMKIFDLELAKFRDRLKKKGYSLTVGKELKKYIVSKVDTRYGARDLIKGIGTYIEDEIIEKLLDPATDLTKKKVKANIVGEKVEITFE